MLFWFVFVEFRVFACLVGKADMVYWCRLGVQDSPSGVECSGGDVGQWRRRRWLLDCWTPESYAMSGQV